MQFSELTIKLLLIFFPGIIAAFIVDNLTSHRERDFKIFLLHAFILGMSSYFPLYLIEWINNTIVRLNGLNASWKVSFLKYLTDGKNDINFSEVFWALVFSIIIGFGIVALINHNVFHKIAKRMKITKKFGSLDVWSHVFESPQTLWVVVRDISDDLMYEGWVSAFSDTYDTNELLLREVAVYRNSTAEKLYEIEGIYLTRKKDEIVIEFPKFEDDNNK